MKDVREILEQRLTLLKNPFSEEWIFGFKNLIEFLLSNPETNRVIQSIKKEKTKDSKQLFQDFANLIRDGRECLEAIRSKFRSHPAVFEQIGPSVEELIHMQIDKGELENPFFDFAPYSRIYFSRFVLIFKKLADSLDTNEFISKYAVLKPIILNGRNEIGVELSFSKYLPKCKEGMKALSQRRSISVWGKWDLSLKWIEWTKHGLSPDDTDLSRLFESQKISEMVQSIGLYFIEQLTTSTTSPPAKQTSIKSLELFLDQNNLYWIIIHLHGQNDDIKPYFIKRLRTTSRSYKLLRQLLSLGNCSDAKFHRLSHTLGELEIKNEIKKAFFPCNEFAGSFVQLDGIDYPINSEEIINHLNDIEAKKKKHLPFQWGRYFSAKTTAR